MARKEGLFARLSLDYADHPKIASLSDAAFRAHIEMILYARKYETDGLIKNRVANRLGSAWDTDVLTELQTNDENAPSLIALENGDFQLHGYEDMQETKEEIAERRARNATNGKKGGRPRKPKKTHSVSKSQTQSGTQKKAETESETESDKENHMRDDVVNDDAARIDDRDSHSEEFALIPPEDAGPSLADKFDEFYRAYPRKRDRAKAEEAFIKAVKNKRVNPDALIEAAHKLASDPNLPEANVIPYATTWLNGERWNDPPYEPPLQRTQSAADRAMQRGAERHQALEDSQIGRPMSWDDVFKPKQIGDIT